MSDLVPVRMLNEVAYCERLFALEWPQREWADSADTVEGRAAHRRVDRAGRTALPEPEDDAERPVVARSVYLASEELGLVAKIDLVEAEGSRAEPVDYKRGRPPAVPEGAWEPERVQVCAQGLLLRAHGYTSDRGWLYFAGARRRVEVAFTDDLIAATLRWRDRAREIAAADGLPPPLIDSPKCPRCSLVGICLPDEHNLLAGRGERVRPLLPQKDDRLPLYVRLHGGSVTKDHGEIVVRDRGEEVGRARLDDTSRLVVLGNVTVTTPLIHELADRDVPIAFHTYGGWLKGVLVSAHGRNVTTRIAQHRRAADPAASLELARAFVHSKILNGRVLLRRNGADVPAEALARLKELAADLPAAAGLESVLGIEGAAARMYFSHVPRMLAAPWGERFAIEGRNRRPPKDPVNALLSFAYAMLARELTVIAHGVGLDPWVGFLHQPRFGRPSLALDLMEEFRPVIADSAVLTAINNGEVSPNDFDEWPTGVALNDRGRRAFLRVFERRMDEVAVHPTFGTRLSYRRILEVQARLLGKVLLGELPAYPEYRIR